MINKRQYILENKREIATSIYDLLLVSEIAQDNAQLKFESDEYLHKPGQFVNLKVDGFYLRRPISVCDNYIDNGKIYLRLIMKIFGEGTFSLSTLPIGAKIEILEGLGKCFDYESLTDEKVILAGGGVGIPPLFFLAKHLINRGKKPLVCLGYRSKQDIFLINDFEKLGAEVVWATDDGSSGLKMLLPDILRDYFASEILPNKLRDNLSKQLGDKDIKDLDIRTRESFYVYSCGPEAMLKVLFSVLKEKKIEGQFSLEERMGCGYGACMGCSHKMKTGIKRICKEGPVFEIDELVW